MSPAESPGYPIPLFFVSFLEFLRIPVLLPMHLDE
jgi:hypothetical protein